MNYRILLVFALCMLAVTPALAQGSPTITVNCTAGQSLNGTLSQLPKLFPFTVFVKGTCSEYVLIDGFSGLTLKGQPGATLQQPGTTPSNGLVVHVLSIRASRSVTIDGVSIHSGASALAAIGVGQNSMDIELRNLTVDGTAPYGLIIYEESQVSLARVTARDPGFATVGVYDVSDVHVESSLLESTTGAGFHEAFNIGTGHVTMQSTIIRNMQIGLDIFGTGEVDIQSFNSYFPVVRPNDVVIDNPAGTNFQGVKVSGGSNLGIGDTKLHIIGAGQSWGGNSAAIWVTDGSTMGDGGGNLTISGSLGQGIFVSNNSHASLTGSSITGGGHGGLVVANQSSVSIGAGNQTLFGGNVTDVFCDSGSLITGGANLAGVPITNCANVLPGDTAPLP